MNADQSGRVASAYRTLGILPPQKNHAASRAYTKYRRRIIARDERLANSESQAGWKSPTDARSPFPFMDLPPELRNRVYRYALVQSRRLHFEILRTPALACTSWQIRRECLPVFLRVNSFQTYFTRNSDGSFGIIFANETLAWLRSLPLTTKFIQDLRFTFQGDIIDRGPKSSAFQIVNLGPRTFVNHFEPRCSFCTDGWYGKSFLFPHPVLDSPALDEIREDPTGMKNDHDTMVGKMEKAYFKRSKAWGQGGLSISDVIDLACAAEAIYKTPVYLQELYDSVHDVADHLDQINLFIDYYVRERTRDNMRHLWDDGQFSTDSTSEDPHTEGFGSMHPEAADSDEVESDSTDSESRGAVSTNA